MNHRLFRFAFFALIPCLVTILVSCLQSPAPPLRVGTNVWPGYEPLYLARDLGYYQEHPSIQIVNYPSATEAIRAYRNRDLEVVALTLDEALTLAETEPQLRVFLVADISQGADVILAKPSLQSLRDLKGKRVGVESTALGAYLLSRALEKAGMRLQDVRVIPLGASEHAAAYKQGQVDAVVTFEPTRSILLAAGARLLFDSTQIPGEIVDVLVTQQSILDNQQPMMKTLGRAWFRSLDYLTQNPQEAARRIAPRQGVTPDQFLAALKLLKIPNLAENQAILSQTDPTLANGAQQLSQIMVDQKLLKQPIAVKELFSNQLVQTLQQP